MSAPNHTPQQQQQGAAVNAAITPSHSHSNDHALATLGNGAGPSSNAAAAGAGDASSSANTPPVPHIRIVPHLDAPRSLHFEVVDKDVPEGFVLKIGRFTDKQSLPNRVTFKSKVVSRGHAEIFTELGKFYIRDTKSSSGTFLNHARLSPPGVESRPTQLKDGDVVQLGVDYQGGTQEIYRCVKMRLELNRSWQQQPNAFRMNTLKVIRNLTTANAASSTDCCICLFRIASFQSLFVAPCSHVYHYKCIRPMLMERHPGFLCPLCRTFADLEDCVEIDDPVEEEMPAEDVAAAIENANQEQGAVVEQVREEPALQAEIPQAEILAEEAGAPTPPSEQAHTFQPPENRAFAADAGAVSHAIQAHQDRGATQPAQRDNRDREVERIWAIEDADIGTPYGSSTPANAVAQSPSTGATSMPMDISLPSGIGSTEVASLSSSAQQSPSSAFFMAPSPPAFTANTGASPVSYGSPRQQLQQNQNVMGSPTNHMAAAGHMIQNFVRNISIPTRNRARTNSNSPLNPMVSQQGVGISSGASTAMATNRQGPMQPPDHVQGDLHADVFGKTLVMAPSLLSLAHGEEASELGAVAEMEAESSSFLDDRPPYRGGSSSHDGGMDGVDFTGLNRSSTDHAMDEPAQHAVLRHPGDLSQYHHRQQQEEQEQQEHSPYQLQQTATAETSV